MKNTKSTDSVQSRNTDLPLFPVTGALDMALFSEDIVEDLVGCGINITEGVMFHFSDENNQLETLPEYKQITVNGKEEYPKFNGIEYVPTSKDPLQSENPLADFPTGISAEQFFYYPVLYKYLVALRDCQGTDMRLFLRTFVPRYGILYAEQFGLTKEEIYRELWRLLMLNFSDDGVLRKYGVDPDKVYGFWLDDEPNTKLFPSIAEVLDGIIKPASDKPSVVTLFSNYATDKLLFGSGNASDNQICNSLYLTYLKEFALTVDTPIWNSDFYPFSLDREHILVPLNARYFTYQLINVLTSALTDKPFWTFAKSNEEPFSESDNSSYITAKDKLMFQVFCNLAFGAKGIAYWTLYPFDKYTVAPLPRWETDANGIKREKALYTTLKNINAQVQAYRHVFMDSVVDEVCCSNTNMQKSSGGEIDPYLKAFGHLAPWTPEFSPVQNLIGADGVSTATHNNGLPRFLFSRIRNVGEDYEGEYLVIINLETERMKIGTPAERSITCVFSKDMRNVHPLFQLEEDVSSNVTVERVITAAADVSDAAQSDSAIPPYRDYNAGTAYKFTIPAGGWKILQVV